MSSSSAGGSAEGEDMVTEIPAAWIEEVDAVGEGEAGVGDPERDAEVLLCAKWWGPYLDLSLLSRSHSTCNNLVRMLMALRPGGRSVTSIISDEGLVKMVQSRCTSCIRQVKNRNTPARSRSSKISTELRSSCCEWCSLEEGDSWWLWLVIVCLLGCNSCLRTCLECLFEVSSLTVLSYNGCIGDTLWAQERKALVPFSFFPVTFFLSTLALFLV